MKKKYLVTGATGFVGSWVTRTLVEKGEDISILVRNRELNWRLKDISEKINIYECDLLHPQIEKVIDDIKPTVVLHIAALGALPIHVNNPNDYIDTNIKGVVNLINAVKKHDLQAFINTGSSSEYGIKEAPMKESDLLEPINEYGVTKASATLFCQNYAKATKLPITTLRLFSPYGCYDDENRLIPYVIKQALKNEPISLSLKTSVRDFIYIEDVVQAYFQSINTAITYGEIINIGSGKQHSIYDIVKHIIAITGSTSEISWGSKPKQIRQIEPTLWQADISKAKSMIQWQPKFTLEEGLKKAIEQYRKTDI